MSDKIEQIQIQIQQRRAPSRGKTDSAALNDTIDEVAHDLASFADQWNDRLVSVMAALPDGIADEDIDAYENGLDGKNMYIDANEIGGTYFNSVKTRPNTIHDQFVAVYSEISSVQQSLEGQISTLATSAASISIADATSIYSADNVEDALTEVMAKVNLVADTGSWSGSTNKLAYWISETEISDAEGLSWDGSTLEIQGDVSSPIRAALKIVPQDADPTGPNELGDMYITTTSGILKICTVAGTPGTWISVGAQI